MGVHHLTNAVFHYLVIGQTELEGWKNNAGFFGAMISSLEY